MITKLRKANAYIIRKFCSDYAIDHVIPRSFGEIPVKMRYKSMYFNNIKSLSDIMYKYPERSKRIVFTTANGYKPQYEYKFRHVNYEKAVRMMMFFEPKVNIKFNLNMYDNNIRKYKYNTIFRRRYKTEW
nr:MAG TPA: hypothetical protein [Caudoviricetes sp.]